MAFINSNPTVIVGAPGEALPDPAEWTPGTTFVTSLGERYVLLPTGAPAPNDHAWVAADVGGSVVEIGIIDLTTEASIPLGGGPIPPADMEALAQAITFQLSYHLRPAWPGLGAVRARVVTDITEFDDNPNLWPHGLVDSSNALYPGSAGAHGYAVPLPPPPGGPAFVASPPFGPSPHGRPWMISGLAEADGILVPNGPGPGPLSMTVSHESCEAVVDPRPYHSRNAPCFLFSTCEANFFGGLSPSTATFTDGAPFLSIFALEEVGNPGIGFGYFLQLPSGQLVALQDFATQDYFFQPFVLVPGSAPAGTRYDFLDVLTDAYELTPFAYISVFLMRSSMLGPTMPWPAVQQNPYILPACAGLPASPDPAAMPPPLHPALGPWARVTTVGPDQFNAGQFTLFASDYRIPAKPAIAGQVTYLPAPAKAPYGVSAPEQIAEALARAAGGSQAAPRAAAAQARSAAAYNAGPGPSSTRRLSLEQLRTLYGPALFEQAAALCPMGPLVRGAHAFGPGADRATKLARRR